MQRMWGERSFEELQEDDQGCVGAKGILPMSPEVLSVLKACFRVTSAFEKFCASRLFPGLSLPHPLSQSQL